MPVNHTPTLVLTWCDATNVRMVASVGHKEHRLLLTIVEHLHGQRNVMIIIIENGINAGMLWDKLVDACRLQVHVLQNISMESNGTYIRSVKHSNSNRDTQVADRQRAAVG